MVMAKPFEVLETAISQVVEKLAVAALKDATDDQVENEFESRGLGESYYETAYDEAYESVDKAVAMIRGGDVDGGLLFIERMVRPKFGSTQSSLYAYQRRG